MGTHTIFALEPAMPVVGRRASSCASLFFLLALAATSAIGAECAPVAHGEQTADGERFADPGQPGTRALLDGLKDLNVPVMAHWEVYDWDRDWPNFRWLYAEYPRQIFIWPHAGFGSAGQVAEVLATNGNVVVTLSKKEEANRSMSDRGKAALLGEALVDDCGTLVAEWRALILKYPDRFLFATDAHKDFRWERYGRIVERWRAILAQLPAEAAAAVAFHNAERLYGSKHQPAK